MSTVPTLVRNGGVYHLAGPVTMAHATSLLEQGGALFDGDEAVVDLGQVTDVDSSAVSLMLEWLRRGGSRQRLRFVNLPPNLVSLANLYGVMDTLQAESA
jgi:phospholipid transport system transporter-binding protein